MTWGGAAKDSRNQKLLGQELQAAGWSNRQSRKAGQSRAMRWYAPLPEGEALVQRKPRCTDCGVKPQRGDEVDSRCTSCRIKYSRTANQA